MFISLSEWQETESLCSFPYPSDRELRVDVHLLI